MTQKKPASKPASRDRVVYEVKGPQGTKQIDAASTAELKKALVPLLGLDPYGTQAVAHLAHIERATVTGNGWSIKRLGVLAFVPDTAEQPQRRKADQTPAIPDNAFDRENPPEAEPQTPAEQPQGRQRATVLTANPQRQQDPVQEEQMLQQKLLDDSKNH